MQLTAQSRRVLIADLTLVLVAFIWGLGIPISASMVRALSPLWSSALRMAVAAVAVFALYSPRIRNATRREWKYAFFLSCIVAVVFMLMSSALVYSTASKQAFIIGMSVLMVPFLAWIVNKVRPHPLVFAGAALGTAGLLVMAFTPGMRFNFGDTLNLIMCVFWAAQVIVIEYIVKRMEPTTLVALQLPLVAAILIAASFLVEGPVDLAAIRPLTWGQIVFTGLANTVLCFVLQTRAQRHTSASHAAIILALESVFGYLISVLSGQDPFILRGALGGLMITGGVVLSELETVVQERGKAPLGQKNLTGINISFAGTGGGASWENTKTPLGHISSLLKFLESKRLLTNPIEMEMADHCVSSALEIKNYISNLRTEVPFDDETDGVLLNLVTTCNIFLDQLSPLRGSGIIYKNGNDWANSSFSYSMKEFRQSFRKEIHVLSQKYNLIFKKDIPEQY